VHAAMGKGAGNDRHQSATDVRVQKGVHRQAGLNMIHHLIYIEYQYIIYRISSSNILKIDK
jgi:hypothetical protein